MTALAVGLGLGVADLAETIPSWAWAIIVLLMIVKWALPKFTRAVDEVLAMRLRRKFRR